MTSAKIRQYLAKIHEYALQAERNKAEYRALLNKNTVRTRSTDTGMLPDITDSFVFPDEKAHIFSLKLTRLIWTPD